jgi:hypothetical protein
LRTPVLLARGGQRVLAALPSAAAPIASIPDFGRVKVEVHESAKIGMGTGEHHRKPDSRASADHSIRCVVAGALMDKRATPAYFAHAAGAKGDLLQPKTDAEVGDKFRAPRRSALGAERVESRLSALWRLDEMKDVSALSEFVAFVWRELRNRPVRWRTCLPGRIARARCAGRALVRRIGNEQHIL